MEVAPTMSSRGCASASATADASGDVAGVERGAQGEACAARGPRHTKQPGFPPTWLEASPIWLGAHRAAQAPPRLAHTNLPLGTAPRTSATGQQLVAGTAAPPRPRGSPLPPCGPDRPRPAVGTARPTAARRRSTWGARSTAPPPALPPTFPPLPRCTLNEQKKKRNVRTQDELFVRRAPPPTLKTTTAAPTTTMTQQRRQRPPRPAPSHPDRP